MFLTPLPRPHIPTLFPYTTLFRSECPEVLETARTMLEVIDAALLGRKYYQVRANVRGTSAEAVAHAVAEHRSEEHTSELQSLRHLVCRLLLEKKKYYDRVHTLNMH